MKNSIDTELNGFQNVCRFDDLKENEGRRFLIDDVETALFKVKGTVYALSNICPHQHSPLIYDGFIEDDCVVCPLHGWKFQLADGKLPSGGRGLQVFDSKVINGEVYVKVEKKELKW